MASLLDGVRASGNKDVHVTMSPTERGYRLGPLFVPVDEEAEGIHVKFLNNTPPRRTFNECVRRFNANVPYSGLTHSVTQDGGGIFTENKEKLIMAALQSLVASASKERDDEQKNLTNYELESQFQALRRLIASKIGYAAFTTLNGSAILSFCELLSCSLFCFVFCFCVDFANRSA